MIKATTIIRTLLAEAESRFGIRTHPFPVFVACNPDGPYPFTAVSKDQNSIFVLLPEDVFADPQRARFQMAHEAVHCLEPCKKLAPVIEEGIATLFSLTESGISRACAQKMEATLPQLYLDALADVRSLIGLLPDAIRMLRTQAPLRNLTACQIQRVTGAPPDLAQRLCEYRRN